MDNKSDIPEAAELAENFVADISNVRLDYLEILELVGEDGQMLLEGDGAENLSKIVDATLDNLELDNLSGSKEIREYFDSWHLGRTLLTFDSEQLASLDVTRLVTVAEISVLVEHVHLRGRFTESEESYRQGLPYHKAAAVKEFVANVKKIVTDSEDTVLLSAIADLILSSGAERTWILANKTNLAGLAVALLNNEKFAGSDEAEKLTAFLFDPAHRDFLVNVLSDSDLNSADYFELLEKVVDLVDPVTLEIRITLEETQDLENETRFVKIGGPLKRALFDHRSEAFDRAKLAGFIYRSDFWFSAETLLGRPDLPKAMVVALVDHACLNLDAVQSTEILKAANGRMGYSLESLTDLSLNPEKLDNAEPHIQRLFANGAILADKAAFETIMRGLREGIWRPGFDSLLASLTQEGLGSRTGISAAADEYKAIAGEPLSEFPAGFGELARVSDEIRGDDRESAEILLRPVGVRVGELCAKLSKEGRFASTGFKPAMPAPSLGPRKGSKWRPVASR